MAFEKQLSSIAKFHKERPIIVVSLALLITLILGIGLTRISLETDISKELPQDMPVVNDLFKIRDEYGGTEPIIIVARLDYKSDAQNAVRDIRDSRVMKLFLSLDDKIKRKSGIEGIFSAASFFTTADKVPNNLEAVKSALDSLPTSAGFFNKEYDATLFYALTPASESNSKIRELTDSIQEDISSTDIPPGVELSLSGLPFVRSELSGILVSDMIRTLAIAAFAILLMLMLVKKSIKKGFFIFLPLVLGLIWTLGLVGWFNIPLSIATVGMGAVVIGLGVDFSTFYEERYEEERQKGKSPAKSLEIALPSVGSAIIGSSVTTITAFLALILATISLLHDLGIALAAGIFFCMFAAVIVNPALIYLFDKKTNIWATGLETNYGGNLVKRFTGMFKKYGSFVGKSPAVVLLFVVILTAIAFVGQARLEIKSPEMHDILPEEIKVVEATEFVLDEFGGFEKGIILIEIEPGHIKSDEARDIRDPEIVNYVSLLSKSIEGLESVSDAQSIADAVSENNRIPKDIERIKQNLVNSPLASQFVDEQYKSTVIFFGLEEDIIEAVEEKTAKDIKEIIEITPKPAGVKASLTGNFAIYDELEKQTQSDMSKTSIVALLFVVAVVWILFRSIRHGLTVLTVVGLGSFWTLGMVGLIGKSMTPTSAAFLAMIIGIGDDFGIQVVNRFRQEIKKANYKKAIADTLQGVIIPILITVLAAVIGFRAMALGEITVAQDLANFVSLGIVFCMLAALTIVPALLVLMEKRRAKKVSRFP